MTEQVRRTIRRYRMIQKDETVLCGLSGGADSVSLLLCLHEMGVSVCACHLNHGLRGEQSDGDERFCKELCERYDIPFLSRRTDAAEYARQTKQSLETAARELRYAFFDECARTLHADKTATAHTADDNLETMLFRLIRGTGAAGLAGIPPVRGAVIRPLIEVERAQVEAYLNGRGQDWRTDETNLQDDCTRNQIRHSVMPALRSIAPDAAFHAGTAARLLRQDDDALEQRAQELCTERYSGWINEPEAVRSRIVRRLLSAAGVPEGETGSRHIAAAERLCEAGNGSLSLPGGFTARADNGRLTVSRRNEPDGEILLRPEQTAEWGDWEICLTADRTNQNGWESVIALSRAIEREQELRIRKWKSSDRLKLAGARGARTLKRLYSERGIAPEERDGLPVLCLQDGTAAAAAGVGADERFCPEDKENDIWLLVIKRRTKL